jgi:polyphosphate glucokinase
MEAPSTIAEDVVTPVRCVDIGATSIGVGLVEAGALRHERSRRTRPPVSPEELMDVVASLVAPLEQGPVAVGFPGIVEEGRVRSASNLGAAEEWKGIELAVGLETRIGAEVRVANDADLAALGCSRGLGVELTVTLGTGVGTGLVVDGVLQHHLELSEIPIGASPSLDAHVGEAVRKELDEAEWDARVLEVLSLLDAIVVPDQIWLAGGNARRLRRDSLGSLLERTWVVPHPVGILGGAALYR